MKHLKLKSPIPIIIETEIGQYVISPLETEFGLILIAGFSKGGENFEDNTSMRQIHLSSFYATSALFEDALKSSFSIPDSIYINPESKIVIEALISQNHAVPMASH